MAIPPVDGVHINKCHDMRVSHILREEKEPRHRFTRNILIKFCFSNMLTRKNDMNFRKIKMHSYVQG